MMAPFTVLREFPGHGTKSRKASWSLVGALTKQTELRIQRPRWLKLQDRVPERRDKCSDRGNLEDVQRVLII